MKLIVGLGNPGREYKNTRHNVGFNILDNYLGKVKWKTKLDSDFYIVDSGNEDVIFLKPQTYMNLSGIAVRKIKDYYKIAIDDILVIQDDLDLKVGTYKIKRNSSSGGHNGIKSIISELNTDAFARLKVGIGNNKLMPTDKYVLGKLSLEEQKTITSNYEKYNEIIDAFIKNGYDEIVKITSS